MFNYYLSFAKLSSFINIYIETQNDLVNKESINRKQNHK